MNTTAPKIIEGFFRHNEHEKSITTETTRSSALFYVRQSQDFNTEILFFNYWKIKRGLAELDLKFTLRSMSGEVLNIKETPLNFTGSWTMPLSFVRPAAVDGNEFFEGSVEVEIFSKNNMFIPYPAVIVRYYGKDWHTTTHSYSRILSARSADLPQKIENLQKTVEGNWTVVAGPAVSSFFIIHNGPVDVGPHEIELSLINSEGDVLKTKKAITGYRPFETRKFFIDDLCDAVAFLNDKPGTMEFSTLVGGVFPRMLVGQQSRTSEQVSVDHSNFNYTGSVGSSDAYPVHENKLDKKHLGFSVPCPAGEQWKCYVDFYPTYPDSNYSFTTYNVDQEGQFKKGQSGHIGLKSEKLKNFRLDVKKSLEDSLEGGRSGSVDFEIVHSERVPSRFHMGVHYQFADGMPAFLIDGPMPYIFQGKYTRWMPIFNPDRCENYFAITNQKFDRALEGQDQFQIDVYNDTSLGGKVMSAQLELKVGATFGDRFEKLMPSLAQHLDGKHGWAYITSKRPTYSIMHYIGKYGPNSLAVDHAF